MKVLVRAHQYHYKQAEEGCYIAIFPSLLALGTEGDTLGEARAMAADAIRGHLESFAEDGLPIPPGDSELQ